tara:strand:- start:1726 stop:2049 length:324 start_codon:yes stop_codon:yes gene_type:complete
MQGRYEGELFSSVHMTQKGCALACIADVLDFHGIDSDDEALQVMNDLNPYAETDGEQTEPIHWNHEILKDMTSEQLWEVFRQWCEISYDRFGDRCYDIGAEPMEIQA